MIDTDDIRLQLCEAVRIAIGDDLSQQPDPPNDPETIGTIVAARPSKEAPIPEYPYAMVELLGTRNDDAWELTNYYSEDEGGMIQETAIVLQYQVTVLGENTLQLSHKLKTAFRRTQIIEHFSQSNLGILDAEVVTSTPNKYDTDYVEQGIFILELRAMDRDIIVDEEFANYIAKTEGEGYVQHYDEDPDPLEVDLDVDTTTP